jgi:SAM-dependent methyltransferase
MKNIAYKTLETMALASWYNRWLFSQVKSRIGGRILDVGCGIGNFTPFLLTCGEVFGIDVDGKSMQRLNSKYKGKAKFGFGDIEKGSYFFGRRKFDSVFCFNVLEHIKDDSRALKNIFKLLSSGGSLVLIVPAHNFLMSGFDQKIGHFRRYSKDALKDKLLLAGFKEVSVRYLNWWAAIGWFLLMKLGRRKSLPDKSLRIFDLLGKVFLFPEKFISPPFGLSVLATAYK